MTAKEIEKFIEKLSNQEKRIFYNKLLKWNSEQIKPDQINLIKEAKEIITFCNLQWGKRFKPIDKYIRLIANKIKTYSYEEVQAVVLKQKSDWYFRKNPKYLNPETIFGNKFHKYVQNITQQNEEDFDF